ncbi:MAG: n-acetylglutamate synthase [Bacteroidota bacterium]
MSTISYEGRQFRAVSNASNGEVSQATRFEYRQRGDVVWATYAGGGVRFGTFIASVDEDGSLDMRYAHVNASGEMMTGECRSTPEILLDGRLRLYETWQWTCGDASTGTSVLEEVVP